MNTHTIARMIEDDSRLTEQDDGWCQRQWTRYRRGRRILYTVVYETSECEDPEAVCINHDRYPTRGR